MLTDAYAPALAESLGVFIPLIVVNCIILGRAESFASKNSVFDSLIDGLGMGLGFTFAVAIIGIIREVLATGTIAYGVYLPLGATGNLFTLFGSDFGAKVFSMPPGAFITLGLILAFINFLNNRKGEAK
jgi:electron transport complex protein RnfE